MTIRGDRTAGLLGVALVLIAVVTAVVLIGGQHSYTIHAQFLNADGLVEGGSVEVAGRKVGTISRIGLSRNGQAEVDLSIDDGDITPLHIGTRAAIRAVGQAGIANRFVDLTPGPRDRPSLADGATLTATQTSGIVNLDALLDSFGPKNRAQLQQLIAHSSEIYAGSGARSFNVMLQRLAPATQTFADVAHELTVDKVALSELITSAEQASTAVAGRHDDLSSALEHTSVALGAMAAERRALSDTLTRAPAVLDQATGTLARTRVAITTLRPALREVPPAARPLRAFLAGTDSMLERSGPSLSLLRRELPQLTAALTGLVPLEQPLVEALRSTGASMHGLRPILRVIRFYGPDLILGVFSGLIGVTSGPYDARGHYGKLNFIQSPQTITSGPVADLLLQHPLAPSLLNSQTGLTRRCPGGLAAPSPDGSSPWLLGQKFCSPEDNMPASVDQP